ncbi:MAG: polysaccharide deacetylase family protein [Candidatus Omnitrophica bacterium]|nr:polysaccharide deacetylase family protein [Candidatus Omnitrophota bacterium]
MNKVPILLYHDFCSETDKSKNNFAVTWENFKSQMDYLHHNGYIAVSLEKMIAELEYWKTEEGGKKIDSRKKVVLTFDDGDLSNYHFVLPILKEKGFSATFFVTINEIGKVGRMDWPMVYDMARNGMGVGSHGLTHSFMTAHNNYTVLNELLMSKQILEKYTRKRVDFLSIPRGFYNKRILTIARDVGFRAVCVSDAGFSDFLSDGLFLLKRFTMRKNYGLNAFRSVVSGHPSVLVTVGENIRTGLRKALGYQVYDRLRKFRHKEKREDNK